MPAFKAFVNSPNDTTSAPKPNFFISFNSFKLAFALTAKHTIGFKLLKFCLKLFIFSFNF